MAKNKNANDMAAAIDTPEASITQPVPDKPFDIQDDEFRGQGGSYIFDSQTGKRARVNLTEQEG